MSLPADRPSTISPRGAAALIGGYGLLFLLVGVLRMVLESDLAVLALPVEVFGVELITALVLLTGRRAARLAAMVVAFLIGLLHLVFALADTPWLARILSAMLVFGHIYAVVLLAAGTAMASEEGRDDWT